MICFFTYKDKDPKRTMVYSSFVELGNNFYLPEDVTLYQEADYSVKETVKRLVEIELEKQPNAILVEICEFDDDEEHEEVE